MMINRLHSFPKLNSSIRILHASPDFGLINIFANGKLLVNNIRFGECTNYLTLAPDTYNLEIFKASDNTTPIASYKLDAIPTMISTLSITTQNGIAHMFLLNDNYKALTPNCSYLRFINLSPNAHLLGLNLWKNKSLFKDVEFLETTTYYPLEPKNYNFFLSSSSFSGFEKRIPKVSLIKNEHYTIYVIGILNGKPPLGYIILKDR